MKTIMTTIKNINDNDNNNNNNNNNNNSNNKLERHQLLKEEISKMKVTVVNEALGAVLKGFENHAHEVGVNFEKSFIRNSTYHLDKLSL